MTTDARTWMEAIEKSYQFYVYIVTLYIICMGAARWSGQTTWRRLEQTRCENAGLPVASCFSGADQGFTYASLFKGGLIGVWVAALQMGYVVIMLATFEGSQFMKAGPANLPADVWQSISILMLFPIAMLVFFVAMILIAVFSQLRHHLSIKSFVVPFIILVAIVAPPGSALDVVTAGKPTIVVLELLAVAALSLCMSYLFGMAEGFRKAEPEANYPVVSVALHHGAGFDRVWLYERTDSDYRFVSAAGANHIVPAANVAKIRKI